MTPVNIGDRAYPTITAAKAVVSNLLQTHPLDFPLVGGNHDLAGDLFAQHPDFLEKCAGRKVVQFEVRKNGIQAKNRGLHAVFDDGASVDFSYLSCLTTFSAETRIRAALRLEIQPQCTAFYGAAGGMGGLHDVDHMPPTFDTLAVEFVGYFSGGWDDPRLARADAPNGFGSVLADRAIAGVWHRYHEKHARLQLVTKAEHRRLTKERKSA